MAPKKLSYTLSISLLNIDQLSHFFTSRHCKKFPTHWHAHHTYYVATLPCKTEISENQQYHTLAGCNFVGYVISHNYNLIRLFINYVIINTCIEQQQQFLSAIRNKQYRMYILHDITAGCQVGRGPSMLTAYNYISVIVRYGQSMIA